MPDGARIPLLLDVDTGIDDALALLYAAAGPEADLLAVTCLSGNVEAGDVARNTLGVLALAGREHVEVAIGRRVPLVRPLEITPETHGPGGIGHARLPEPSRSVSERFGPDVIVEAARSRPGEVVLVTLGPLTNLALALREEPDLPRLLRRWVMMGGAFTVPGNTTPVAEWNIHCDPEAAHECFAAWQAAVDADSATPRMLAMGLDVTEGARIGPRDLGRIAGHAGAIPGDDASPILGFLDDALRWYFEFHQRYDGFYGAFIHDPFVVAAALDPALLVRTEAWPVDVDTAGGAADALTIADRRGIWGRRANADVVVEADAGTFVTRLVERIGGLAAQR
jgi:purine nucleosidase